MEEKGKNRRDKQWKEGERSNCTNGKREGHLFIDGERQEWKLRKMQEGGTEGHEGK